MKRLLILGLLISVSMQAMQPDWDREEQELKAYKEMVSNLNRVVSVPAAYRGSLGHYSKPVDLHEKQRNLERDLREA